MERREGNRRQQSPIIEVDYGAAYELLLSMSVFADSKDHHDYEVGSNWFDVIHARVSVDILQSIDSLYYTINLNNDYMTSWINLLGLVHDSPAPKDVPTFLSYLANLDPLELRLHLFGYYKKYIRRLIPLDIIVQAAEGDSEAQQQFVKLARLDSADKRKHLLSFLACDAETQKNALLQTLHGWYEQFFCDQEQDVLPILAYDAESKRRLQETLTAEQLIETATNGLEYVPEPGLRRVLLVPSYVERPWNVATEYQDMKVFCYPVADEFALRDQSIPPTRLVRLYKALADERRLRILKLLMTRNYSLQELSEEFNLAKSTLHHHLVTLRTAGLVRIRESERDNVYSLRPQMLTEAAKLLDSYLKGSNA